VGSGKGAMPPRPPPQKIFEIFMQNSEFSCKIFACFKMHSVNRGAPPFESAIGHNTSVTDRREEERGRERKREGKLEERREKKKRGRKRGKGRGRGR